VQCNFSRSKSWSLLKDKYGWCNQPLVYYKSGSTDYKELTELISGPMLVGMYTVVKKVTLFISVQFLQTLTNCYDIWRIVYRVNFQHSNFWYTCLIYILLLHYLGGNFFPQVGALACCVHQLVCRKTLMFIPADLWLANSRDLNRVDYRIFGMMHHMYQMLYLIFILKTA